MFRNILLFVFIVAGNSLLAQITLNPDKSGKMAAEPVTDYKVAGAPMPDLRMRVFHDTNSVKTSKLVVTNSGAAVPDVQAKSNDALPATQGTGAAVKKHGSKKNRGKESGNPSVPASTEIYRTGSDYNNGANLFVMMFNPTCSHCEDETEMLEKNMALFTKSRLILLANPGMWDYLPNFYKSFHIPDYPLISIGVDTADFINKVFMYSALPQINIYDGNRKLIRFFSGQTPIDSLKPYIQ